MKIIIFLLIDIVLGNKMKIFEINKNKFYISKWEKQKYSYLDETIIKKSEFEYFYDDGLYVTFNVNQKSCEYNMSNLILVTNRHSNINSCINYLKSTALINELKYILENPLLIKNNNFLRKRYIKFKNNDKNIKDNLIKFINFLEEYNDIKLYVNKENNITETKYKFYDILMIILIILLIFEFCFCGFIMNIYCKYKNSKETGFKNLSK